MPVFPIDQLKLMRPEWCALHEAGVSLLSPGDIVEEHFHDSGEYLFVLEGRLALRLGPDTMDVVAGEVVLAQTGEDHAITAVHEPSVVLWLKDGSQPPFREGHLTAERVAKVPPKVPLPAPDRLGHLVRIEADGTFVPQVLRAGKGDLALALNPGALGESQAREIRKQCDEYKQAVGALLLDVEDREIDTYFYDRFTRQNLDLIQPHNLCMRCDPSSPEAAKRIRLLRDHWLQRTRVSNRTLCLEFDMRAWSPAEMGEIMGHLAKLPPAEWGVALHWDDAVAADVRSHARPMAAAMLPWLRVVFCQKASIETVSFGLAAFGYQGWIIAK